MTTNNTKEQWLNAFKQHVLSPGVKLNVRQKRISSLLIAESLSDDQRNTLNDLLHAEYEVVQALKVAGKARFKTRRVEADAKKKRVRRAFDLVDLLVKGEVVDGKTLEFVDGVNKELLVGLVMWRQTEVTADFLAHVRKKGAVVISEKEAEIEKAKAARQRLIQQGKQRRAALRDALS